METRYYILSRRITAPEFAAAVRGHWRIENNLHWQWDVSFREDECRECRDPAPADLSVIRRFALGLRRSCKPSHGGVACEARNEARRASAPARGLDSWAGCVGWRRCTSCCITPR